MNQRRAELARRLSQLYAAEVPKYGHLVDATQRVNARAASSTTADVDQQRIGGERHGAIRLASFEELAEIARLFRFFGMAAVGYYDLRNGTTPIPVVATAFRPLAATDLDASPFRMFTSTLVADDKRFFSADLQAELTARETQRQLFPQTLPTLLDALDHSADPDEETELTDAESSELIDLAVETFRLDAGPIDASWHQTLDDVSPVAADIAACRGTHLNHLTPRVLDIEALHRLMGAEGVTMIDRIQGPPAWAGPDVLLRQTSFRALDEPRTFVDGDGNTFEGSVRVRFGEVEQRGLALTRKGRAKVDEAMAAGEAAMSDVDRQAKIGAALDASLSHTLEAMVAAGDAYAIHVAQTDGTIAVAPITYEDFLPASAAGIFASNLTHSGVTVPGDDLVETVDRRRDAERLQNAVGVLHDPYALYAAQQAESLATARAAPSRLTP